MTPNLLICSHICLFIYLFLRYSHYIDLRVPNSLCRPSWPQTSSYSGSTGMNPILKEQSLTFTLTVHVWLSSIASLPFVLTKGFIIICEWPEDLGFWMCVCKRVKVFFWGDIDVWVGAGKGGMRKKERERLLLQGSQCLMLRYIQTWWGLITRHLAAHFPYTSPNTLHARCGFSLSSSLLSPPRGMADC